MDKSEHATLALCLLKMAVVSGFDKTKHTGLNPKARLKTVQGLNFRGRRHVSVSVSATQGFSIHSCTQSGNWQTVDKKGYFFPCWHILKGYAPKRLTQLSHKKS